MVHFGTLVPILMVFKKDLLKIFRSLSTLSSQLLSRNHFKESLTGDIQVRLIGLIGIAIVPAVLIGFFFRDIFEQLFSSVFAVGVGLMLTGTLLLLTKFVSHHRKKIENMTFFDAALIGFSQALAITPGISRSGATISTALFLGVDRELAGRFSFLIFIPVIFGAMIANFKLPELYSRFYLFNILAATTAAAITGYITLKTLLCFVHQGKLYIFSPYCYGVGLFAILYALLK